MSVTASSMILSSLRMIGEKTAGGTLTTSEQTDYLYDLNAAMDSWSLDRSMCYQLLQESLALTTSVGSYTIGVGGAFNTTRPNKIVDPCFIRSGTQDYPLTLIDAKTYGSLINKTADGSIPEYLFYDSAFVASLATIFLYPEPSASLTLYINSWKQLQQFALISTAVVLPPGYQLAIESNFALMKAAGKIKASAELVKTARDSMALVKRINTASNVMRIDPGVAGHKRFNIMTGA